MSTSVESPSPKPSATLSDQVREITPIVLSIESRMGYLENELVRHRHATRVGVWKIAWGVTFGLFMFSIFSAIITMIFFTFMTATMAAALTQGVRGGAH